MRNTYKNRPHRSDYSSDEHGLLQFALALNKWCVDSEQELRELIQNLVPQKQYYDFEVERILKEFLGDV